MMQGMSPEAYAKWTAQENLMRELEKVNVTLNLILNELKNWRR